MADRIGIPVPTDVTKNSFFQFISKIRIPNLVQTPDLGHKSFPKLFCELQNNILNNYYFIL